MTVERRSIADLIEASSLGTPEAKAARESTDPALAAEIVRRSMDADDDGPCGDLPTHDGMTCDDCFVFTESATFYRDRHLCSVCMRQAAK